MMIFESKKEMIFIGQDPLPPKPGQPQKYKLRVADPDDAFPEIVDMWSADNFVPAPVHLKKGDRVKVEVELIVKWNKPQWNALSVTPVKSSSAV